MEELCSREGGVGEFTSTSLGAASFSALWTLVSIVETDGLGGEVS